MRLRNATHRHFLPVVLSVLLNACSDNSAEILDFSIREGRIYKQFFRQGPVAAHTVLTSGTQPRLVVAFPAGLLTPVGVVVANPVFAPKEQRQLFTNNHYHGTVVWSWHQELLAAGLKRQLQRTDLPTDTRQHLIDTQARLWQVIASTNAIKNSELWSWSYNQGDFRLEPFGQRSSDETESNAAQLWSTVYLAIEGP